jgi:uncharacterized OsmC-like protein
METTMNVQKDMTSVQNGVNTEALLGARAALAETPSAGQFTWRADCDWVTGTHSRSTVQGFFGLGAEQEHTKAFTLEADHPPQFASADNGATPVEMVLSALASCLTAGVAAVAQHRGIQLKSVRAKVEGDMDIAGILGVDPDVRNGFSAIRVSFDIDADATPDEIAALVAQSQKRSAVFDIIANPANVTVSAN